jgi:hypothetical protein
MTFIQNPTRLIPLFAAKATVFLLLLALLTGCAAPEPVAEGPTPTHNEAFRQDAQQYATEMGITLEEALARLSKQNEEAISALQNQLQTHEAETFAGLWLQHQPEYRVVVAFTRDGAETIRRYVPEDSDLFPLLDLRSAQYSYAQLKADQRAVSQILEQLQQAAVVSILVMDNHVALEVTDLTTFTASLTAANLTLPERVVVKALYEPVGENPPFAITPAPDVFMPQLKQRDVVFMTALLIGDLLVEEGCLRIRDIYTGESRLVIWQADYFLTDNDGVLAILDETGEIVAQVGERVFLGGGGQPILNEAELRQPLPDSCDGPYWRMGGFLPEEYVPNVSADLPPQMQLYAGGEMGLAFDYPLGWYVHEAGKSLQITPNAQPTWSSFFDPNQPHGGPAFDLLHNLNRQMGATPLAEIEILLEGFGDGVMVLDPAKPLPHQPHIAVGLYRFADDAEMVLLLGAAVNPLPDTPQPAVALSGVVRMDELGKMRIVFETILRTLRPADAP